MALDVLPAQAARHGLSGYVHHLLAQSGAAWPAPVLESLRRHALHSAASGLRVKALLLRVLDVLSARGVTPVVLKGLGLSSRLYPGIFHRSTSDVDILVAPESLPQAEDALEGLGLRRMAQASEDWHRAHHHHVVFSGAAGMVELHFRAITAFGTQIDADSQLARASEGRFEGRAVRFLAPEDELVYLASHAAQHLFARLAWLLDLKLLVIANPGLDWSKVEGRARDHRLHVPVGMALALAHRQLGAPIPKLAGLEPARWQRALGEALFSESRLLQASGNGQWARLGNNLARTLMASDSRAGLRYMGMVVARAGKRRLVSGFPWFTPSKWKT